MKKNIVCGLIGFGTVGSGVFSLLQKNSSLIAERTGFSLTIKTICDIRVQETQHAAPGISVVNDWQAITDDAEIDVVIELIGGINPAKSIILDALNKGKSVVTANKKLLAEDGISIFDAATASGAKLGFEASVGGGIPVIGALRNGLVGNVVQSIRGILNGTTNFILTKMEEQGLSFDEALRDAQRLGFAEADPTFDIMGYDAAHKISILSMLAFNRIIDYQCISIEGISHLDELDITYARDMGYVIKLLGIAKMIDGQVDIRVHPTMLSLKHPLASVRNEFNAVMIDNDMTGPVLFYGRGAGSLPTASAVISDIVQIAQKQNMLEAPLMLKGNAVYVDANNRRSRYYMKLYTEDRPGILSQIAGVLGDNKISIATVIQKETQHHSVPLIIMTHLAIEQDVLNAVNRLNRFDFVNGDVTLLRVENSFDEVSHV